MLYKNFSLLHISACSITYLNMLNKNPFLLHISACSTKTTLYYLIQHSLLKPLSFMCFNMLYIDFSLSRAPQKHLSLTYFNMLYKNLFLLRILTCSAKSFYYFIFEHAQLKPLSITYCNIFY